MFSSLLQTWQAKHIGKRNLGHHVLISGNLSSHTILEFWQWLIYIRCLL